MREPTEQERAKARSLLIAFAVWVFGALLFAALPFPWLVIALVPAVCAVVWGVRAIAHMRRIGAVGSPLVIVTIGMALSGYLVLQSGAMLVTWDTQSEYAACRVGAVTIAGQNECDAQYRQSLENLFGIDPAQTPSPTPSPPSPTDSPTPSPSSPTSGPPPAIETVSSVKPASTAP